MQNQAADNQKTLKDYRAAGNDPGWAGLPLCRPGQSPADQHNKKEMRS